MNASEALGTLAAATLLAIIDVRGVLLVDAATFLVSAALLAFLPTLAPVPPEEGGRFSFLSDAKAGLGYIWSEPLVRIIGLGYFTVVASNGIDDVALIFRAKDSLHGGDAAASILYGRRVPDCWLAIRCWQGIPDVAQ